MKLSSSYHWFVDRFFTATLANCTVPSDATPPTWSHAVPLSIPPGNPTITFDDGMLTNDSGLLWSEMNALVAYTAE